MAKYNSDSIETLSFPENIRKNPAMYIGGVDAHGMFVVLRELLDNAADEYLAGRNKSVGCFIDKDGSYWVQDGGSGIPQGIKAVDVLVNGKTVKSKMPTMQSVFGVMHTSGKFRSDAYAVSVGCFDGGTKVELVDGRTLTMRQIYQEYKRGIQNYVWTIHRKTGELRAQPIERAIRSGKTTAMVKVKLDTGEQIFCTPNHPLYQTSLEKVDAENSLGCSLVSAKFSYDKDGYRTVTGVPASSRRLHRVVAEYNGLDIEDRHVHHLDENVTNNEPTNLKSLSPSEHYEEHPRKLAIWLDYVAATGWEKSALLSTRNRKKWYKKRQIQGKALKIACRVLHLGLPLSQATFDKHRFHGAPKWDKARSYFSDGDTLGYTAKSLLNLASQWSKRGLNKGKNFLSSLDYKPGTSSKAMVFDHSAYMEGKRLIGKAVASLIRIPSLECDAFTLNECFEKSSSVSARALSTYVDLDEFVSAVREGVDPSVFMFRELSDDARFTRRTKYDKDDILRRSATWPNCSVNRFSNLFLRNVNALLAAGKPVTRSSYRDEFKNAANGDSWYLGVRACILRGIIGKDAVLEAARDINHKVVSVEHFEYDEPTHVYDLSVGIDHNYRLACGVFVGNTHGVGAKGTNATADYFEVFTCYKDKWYSIKFKRGILTQEVKTCKAPTSPITGKTMKKGTLIHYKPDSTIFAVKTFPPSMLIEWAEIMSYLNPGFQIALKVKEKSKVFLSKEGPKEYIADKLKKLGAEAETDMFEFNDDLSTAVVAFSNVDGFELRGFTNGLANSQGGKHVDSVANALFKALQAHAGAKQAFTAHDFRDGMLGIVNAKLHKAQFSSQDKAKLTDERMGKDFEATVLKAAEKFFKSNKAMAKRLCDRASKINELKNKFKSSKAVATALNKVKKAGLPPNYAPAHRSVPVKDRELFIVEGDSAAGGFRKVRKKNQALLPLSGKILNVLKAKGDKALVSKAIINILGAMGFDPKAADPLAKLQVGKVVCLADPDPDGAHINCLLLTLFSTYLPGMFERGMIYVADMPEFYAIHKDQLFVGPTLSSVQAKLDKGKIKADVFHAKGWGEVDEQVLKILAVDDSRKLLKLDAISATDKSVFNSLMGRDEPAPAKEAE